MKNSAETLLAQVLWNAQKAELTVPAHPGSAKVSFELNAAHSAAPFKIELPAGRKAFSCLEVHSFPQDREFKCENKGYGIERQYEKLLPDGSTAEASDLRVGDMVVISLKIEIGEGDRYLTINDPLPSELEAIKPEFGTQNEREGDQLPKSIEAWSPARIEAMCQPDKYGLTPNQHLRTLPSGGGQVAGK